MPTSVSKPPLHPFSALAVIAIDGVSTLAELAVTATLIGVLLVPVLIALSGLMSFFVVALIEHEVARRTWGAAALAGAIMGLLTALPYVFAGGLAGGVLLAWAGMIELQKPQKNK